MFGLYDQFQTLSSQKTERRLLKRVFVEQTNGIATLLRGILGFHRPLSVKQQARFLYKEVSKYKFDNLIKFLFFTFHLNTQFVTGFMFRVHYHK